ncbi:NAD(P)-binding protein [Rhizodiscina lignyota]|uniref:NAD(P)-binding protein n=1 Tax=Rhizodiscina lignyota TaxID=1504668 RepID=A0A9P4I3D9_9PEZI|nr:NAD(P)-binding protein [Rhizodiscina lignyota]
MRQHNNLFGLDHRTIILTGGLGTMGVSLSKTLLMQGADIISADLSESPETEVWNPLLATATHTGGQIVYIQCDVTNEDSVAKAFEKAETAARHPIRGLVTLAGISGRCPAIDYPLSAFRKIIDVNVIGTFLCATAAARIFHRQMVSGSIVMFGSMSGTNVNRGVDTAAYNTSKSAVLQLARNLAAEWGNDGIHPAIRVNTVSPGYIIGPMTIPTLEQLQLKDLWEGGNMLGRLSTAEEHQSSVVFLLADGSSYVTGMDLRADGGHCAW